MMNYTIQIEGHLDPGWSTTLQDANIVHQPDGTSSVRGQLPDQTALIAVLMRLNDLGVTVLSVERQVIIRQRCASG